MFPIIYNISFMNVINLINIKYSAKKLFFFYAYSKKNLIALNFLKYNDIIDDFIVVKKKNKYFFFIKLLYYKQLKVIKNFKNYFSKTQYFFISLKALQLIKKKTGTSFYVISTPFGFLTHTQAIEKKKGGLLIGSFFN